MDITLKEIISACALAFAFGNILISGKENYAGKELSFFFNKQSF